MPGVNPYLHCSVPNLFGLPSPVLPAAVKARVPLVVLVTAAHARSALATSVDQNSTSTVLRDQRLSE